MLHYFFSMTWAIAWLWELWFFLQTSACLGFTRNLPIQNSGFSPQGLKYVQKLKIFEHESRILDQNLNFKIKTWSKVWVFESKLKFLNEFFGLDLIQKSGFLSKSLDFNSNIQILFYKLKFWFKNSVLLSISETIPRNPLLQYEWSRYGTITFMHSKSSLHAFPAGIY